MVTSRFRYDDGGNRIYKDAPGNKEYYFRDDLGHELAIFDMTTDRLKTLNLYGSDLVGRIDLSWTSQYDYEFEQYVWLRSDSRKYYYVKDHLGSIRQTLNEAGVVMSAMDYYTFGGTMSSYVVGSTVDKYKFTGKERDTETGRDYFGARYYNPLYGRWMSVDPLAEKYPGLSPYNYCANNPLIYFDPNGKDIRYSIDNKNKTISVTIRANFKGDVSSSRLNGYANSVNEKYSFTADGGKYAGYKINTILKTATDQSNNPDYYQVSVKPSRTGNERSGAIVKANAVDGEGNSVVLYTNQMSNDDFAHEIGHTMGNSDEYEEGEDKNNNGKIDDSLTGHPDSIMANYRHLQGKRPTGKFWHIENAIIKADRENN